MTGCTGPTAKVSSRPNDMMERGELLLELCVALSQATVGKRWIKLEVVPRLGGLWVSASESPIFHTSTPSSPSYSALFIISHRRSTSCSFCHRRCLPWPCGVPQADLGLTSSLGAVGAGRSCSVLRTTLSRFHCSPFVGPCQCASTGEALISATRVFSFLMERGIASRPLLITTSNHEESVG